MSAIFDGLAHLISYLEIPPKFYDPTVEEYNPILYEVDKAISQFTPSDIIAKEVIKKSGIKTEKNVTPEHLTFAFKVGLWNGLVGTVKSIPELASLQHKGIQFLYDKEFRKELIDKFDEWIEKCNKYNDSDTYVGCAWDMLWEHIKQAHTTGSSPKIAQQYGKSTFDLITIPLGMVKAGKLGKINKIMDLLDPISNTMKIAGKTVKVTFNTTRRTFKYVINTAGKNFKRYELRFKIDGNTLYCGIPNGKISIIDKLKQADIEKLPVDENGIRIADIDGEAIPIGNQKSIDPIVGKNAEKIFNSAQELAEDIIKNKINIRKNILDLAETKYYARKYFDTVVKEGDFDDWFKNNFSKYEKGTLNFEAHHIIPIDVLKNNDKLQQLLFDLKKADPNFSFDFNGIDNGMMLQKKSLKLDVNGHTSHKQYNFAIDKKVTEICSSKKLSDIEKFEKIEDLIKNAKNKLEKEVLLGNKDVNDIIDF